MIPRKPDPGWNLVPPDDDIPFSALRASGPRARGIPAQAESLFTFRNDQSLKLHPDYKAAKAGDIASALRLVEAMVKPDQIAAAHSRFGSEVTYVPVIAQEQSGDNAIPDALAGYYAREAGGQVTSEIVQTNHAFHTGAGAMERIANRAFFDGAVESGCRYVLVDDVTVMGSTLADLADHIQKGGGEVAGIVTLVNAGRSGVFTPTKAVIRDIERRFGDAVENLFRIVPSGLTADEAAYLRNFKDADALRTRRAAAEVEREARLRANDDE